MPIQPRRTAFLALSAGAIALASAAWADTRPAPPAIPGADIQELDAPDFVTRDRASQDLHEALLRLRSADNADAWPQIERALVRAACEGEMSIEARVRILACLKRQFFDSARAAIGISFGPDQQDTRRIIVQRVHEGFPAGDNAILKAGDAIVSIDGVPISGNGDYMNTTRSMICSRDPGDIVKIAVLRESPETGQVQQLTLDVPLGSFDQLIRPDLPRAMQIGHEALESAWQVRLERLGWTPDAELAVLPPSLPLDEWNQFTRAPHPIRTTRIALAEAAPGADEEVIRQLTNGGTRLVDGRRDPAVPDQLEALRRQLGGERNGLRRNVAAIVADADDPDRALLFMLQNQMAERLQVATRYAQALERINLSDADRKRLQAQHDRELRTIAQLQMQIRDITSQMNAERIKRQRQMEQQQP